MPKKELISALLTLPLFTRNKKGDALSVEYSLRKLWETGKLLQTQALIASLREDPILNRMLDYCVTSSIASEETLPTQSLSGGVKGS